MIIVRSPLRITLGGGGTDLPSYYRDHEGFLIAAAIDKYVYVTVIKPFPRESTSNIRRSSTSKRSTRSSIRSSGSALKQFRLGTGPDRNHDARRHPGRTGLGSSGSFTTALLRALHAHHEARPSARAGRAGLPHRDRRLGEPIGKQDQYIAAFGGITCFTFHQDGTVEAEPLAIDEETRNDLDDNLLLFFTGFSRSPRRS